MESKELTFEQKMEVLDQMEQYYLNCRGYATGMCSVMAYEIKKVLGPSVSVYDIRSFFPEFHKSRPNKGIYWYPLGDPVLRLKHVRGLKAELLKNETTNV